MAIVDEYRIYLLLVLFSSAVLPTESNGRTFLGPQRRRGGSPPEKKKSNGSETASVSVGTRNTTQDRTGVFALFFFTLFALLFGASLPFFSFARLPFPAADIFCFLLPSPLVKTQASCLGGKKKKRHGRKHDRRPVTTGKSLDMLLVSVRFMRRAFFLLGLEVTIENGLCRKTKKESVFTCE